MRKYELRKITEINRLVAKRERKIRKKQRKMREQALEIHEATFKLTKKQFHVLRQTLGLSKRNLTPTQNFIASCDTKLIELGLMESVGDGFAATEVGKELAVAFHRKRMLKRMKRSA